MNVITKIVSDKKKLKSAIVIGLYIFLMLLTAVIFIKYLDRENLKTIVQDSGKWGIAVYFLIEVVYVALTPLFNTLILIASGYIFGGHVGFLINFFATATGLFLIVFLVKKYGRPLLKRLISPKFYSRFDELTQKIGPMTLLVVYVLPFTPDDELTYVVAAGPVGMWRFVLPILLGTLAKATYSYIGDMGPRGLVIAVYARLIALAVGLFAVGIQEHIFFKKSGDRNETRQG